MLDRTEAVRIRQNDELFDGFGEFSIVSVFPRQEFGSGNDGRKPVMPLLSRGQQFDDENGDTWTVLRAHVRRSEASFGDVDQHYWYEYTALAGQYTLH